MNKRQIKKKKEIINKIRDGVLQQSKVLDLARKLIQKQEQELMLSSWKKLSRYEEILEEKIDIEDFMIMQNGLDKIDKKIMMLKDTRLGLLKKLLKEIMEHEVVNEGFDKLAKFLVINVRNRGLAELEFAKIQVQINELIFDEVKINDDMINDIFDMKSHILRLMIMNCKPNEEIIQEEQGYKNIYSHREMNDFAEENGFDAVRQTGSHRMYKKDGICIPIPQHTIGKGLSIAIQKQILNVA